MKNILVSACSFLTSCGNHNAPADNTVSKMDSIKNVTNTSKNIVTSNATLLSINEALLKKYEQALSTNITSSKRQFIKGFLEIIHKFNGKGLDTT